MAPVWRVYAAPDGRKYYYNAVTKHSTWYKPESFNEIDENREVKRFKKIESKPHVALELYHSWYLIICDTGKKFYYNAESNESIWNLPDEASRKLIDTLERNKLVALVGLARGYSFGGLHVYDELVADLASLKQESEAKRLAEGGATSEKNEKEIKEESKDQGQDQDQAFEGDTDGKKGLVTGYSSSSDDEVEVEDGKPQSILAIESIEDPINTPEDKKALWNLFTRYELNPYSAWPFEMKRIRDHPDFCRVLDDSVKEDVFEEWCAHTISGGLNETRLEEDFDEEEEKEEEEDLEPTRFHYLAQIVSKSTITSTTIFMDIRNENKSLFKKYNIKDFISSKKDQESFVSKLLYYYKRMTLEERKEAFIQLLEQNRKTIEENLFDDVGNVRNCLCQEVDTNDSYAVETKLFKMEKLIGLWRNLSNLMEEPKYYILGIREKMLELDNYLKMYVELQ